MEALCFVIGLLCGSVGMFVVFLAWLEDIMKEVEKCDEQREKMPRDI